jgi:hypothetical protein
VRRARPAWWLILVWMTGLLAAAPPPLAWADGYIIPEPMPSSSIMADQRAVIVYRDGREDLVISVDLDFRSMEELPEMAWIVPVPSPPDIGVTDDALFAELDRLSAPEVIYRTEQRGGFLLGGGLESAPPPVTVLERKRVGVYDVAVLAGREGAALLDWLHVEGFQVPDALRPVLDAYVAEEWTFVATRIAPGADPNEVYSAEPLWLSFDAGQMVYPMRLTGVRDEPLALRLYVLADHRYELAGFTVEFAGQVEVQAPDPALSSALKGELYLTKLFDGAVTPAEMAVDFYPHQAPSDEPYREQVVQTYVSAGPGLGGAELLFLCGGCWLGLAVLLVVVVVAVTLLRRRR